MDQHGCEEQQRCDRAEDPELVERDALPSQGVREDSYSQRVRDQAEDDQPAVVNADLDPADREQAQRVVQHSISSLIEDTSATFETPVWRIGSIGESRFATVSPCASRWRPITLAS